MKNLSCLLFILFFSAFVQIYSQVNTSSENATNTIPLSPQDSSEQVRHYLSIDAGYSFNNAVRFRNSINTLFAFNYGYQFSNIVGVEASLYYSDVMKDRGGSHHYIYTSLTGSCSATLQPFAKIPFRFGIGGAVRWYSSLEEIATFVDLGLPPLYFIEVIQFGANMQAEYSFPLTQSIDIGVRGQGQIFFEPFFLNTNGSSAGIPPQLLQIAPQLNPKRMSTVVNAGAFLRIRF